MNTEPRKAEEAETCISRKTPTEAEEPYSVYFSINQSKLHVIVQTSRPVFLHNHHHPNTSQVDILGAREYKKKVGRNQHDVPCVGFQDHWPLKSVGKCFLR